MSEEVGERVEGSPLKLPACEDRWGASGFDCIGTGTSVGSPFIGWGGGVSGAGESGTGVVEEDEEVE